MKSRKKRIIFFSNRLNSVRTLNYEVTEITEIVDDSCLVSSLFALRSICQLMRGSHHFGKCPNVNVISMKSYNCSDYADFLVIYTNFLRNLHTPLAEQ